MTKPYYERNVILCGDVREKLRELPEESVNCVVTSPPSDAYFVQCGRPLITGLHVGGQFGGANCTADMTSAHGYACHLAPLLDLTKCEAVECLLTLYPQVRQDRCQDFDRAFVSYPPSIERPPALGVRVFHCDVAAEGFRQQVDSFTRDLAYVNALTVGGLSRIATNAHGIRTALYPDGSVRIQDASKVGQRG